MVRWRKKGRISRKENLAGGAEVEKKRGKKKKLEENWKILRIFRKIQEK